MEIVVFHSDIARLVLAYLKNQRLEKASRIFCKTSPHLQQEYTAFKQGLQAYSFFPELEEIIREYVKITRKVEQIVAALPEMLRPKFQHKKLSQKLNEFLDRSLPVIIAQFDGGACTKDDCKPTNNSTASCSSVQSDKENKAKQRSDRKRKRNTDSINTSNERSAKNATPKKRRRVLEPFCFLSITRQKARRSMPPHSSASSNDHVLSTENDEKSHDETTDSQERLEDETDVSTDDDEHIDNAEENEDVSILEKPTKESTPRAKTAPPTLIEFSQAILDNPQFQQKLVENINQALQTSGCLAAGTLKDSSNEANESARKTRSSSSQATKLESADSETSLVTSSQILDQLVKDILANTEKDPTFDAIIQDVVDASNTKSLVSERNNVDGTTLTAVETMSGADNISSIPSVPSTPLIIRTIPCNATSNSGDLQAIPSSLTANNSFGSLIDPNFSISKLIVLNSNDSAQKQATDQTLGNTTADNLLNQLASQSVTSMGGNELTSIDDQVYFDVNTGQLTLPLFLTNDGLLTNFPFLINNELITQQLQPDNIANLDATRIEIPLPEPISFSADQLPPNSIIVGSTQKNEPADGIQRTVCKLQKNITAVPASLDSRMNVERATPSTNGIVNAKAFKSLSTPRKRASHVRTLTFSPRSSFVPSTTPLSTRRESLSRFQRVHKTMPTKLEQTMTTTMNLEKTMLTKTEKTKPPNPEVEKIKNVELRSSTKVTVAVTVTDATANESSNSCSVPPLFAMEESSNQTVIKANLPSDPETKTKKPESKIKMVAETPKRKQLRKTAVRACKRVLSKSANEEEETMTIKQQEDHSKTEQIDLNSSKQSEENPKENETSLAEDIKKQKDRMMEEWVRMRSATKNDLDSRLREWNSKMMYTRPNQKCVKKLRKKRGKSLAAIAAKTKANQTLEEEKNVSTEQTNTSGNAGISGNESQAETKAETKAKEKPKTKQLKNPGKTKCKAKDSNSSAEFNIKILTPHKSTSTTELAKKEDRSKVKVENEKQEEEVKQDSYVAVDNANQAKVLNPTDSSCSLAANNNAAKPAAQSLSTQIHSNSLEREKRTANIACLLETPFKDAISSSSLTASSCVPPTPGVFGTSFETPLSKVKPTSEDLHSHSFLFGSLTKSELETPLLSAITPGGFKFTPFGPKDATPRSVTATECSSGGGSYYRPDESDDLDRNIDKLLRDSAQKNTTTTPEKVELKTEVERNKSLEIPAEKLKVEPIVLKRVKSFGSEGVDTAVSALANIDPHYTLAAGLPEVSGDEATSSSSSSSATSSSSSSSSSSGTSSASSRSSSLKSNNGKNSETVIERHDGHTSLNVSLALENLSEISSTEDDEWQKLVVSDGEDSQLVDHEGEVRYPVRSWLTPSKVTNTSTTATTKTAAEPTISNPIKVKLPIKISEKRNKHLSELEEKRQRMKSKLKNDSAHKKRFQNSSVAQAQAATRRLQLAKEVKLKKMQQLQIPQEKRLPDEDTKACTIDVLTALHLSAKKQSPVGVKETRSLEVIPKLPPLGDVDDNAVSNVFDSASAAKQSSKHDENTGTLETPKTKTLQSPVKPKQTTTKQRKCLHIEARPVGSARGAKGGGTKKAPARSKAAASSMPADTAEAEVIMAPEPKPSPVPKIKIKSSVGVNINRPKLKTFYGQSKSVKNNRDNVVSTEKISKPIVGRKLKTPVKKPGGKLPQKQTASQNKQQQAKQQKEEMQDFPTSLEPKRKYAVEEPIKTKMEQKVDKQRKSDETENQESAIITQKIIPVAESVAAEKLDPPAAATPVSHSCSAQLLIEEDEDISDDDDPLKYCTLSSYTEDDDKGHFITLKYKGRDGEAPKQSNTVYNLSNFRMVIAFDEDEQHTLQVSEEYCLFECKPKQEQATKTQPKIIPKKRRLRVATTSTSDDSVESTLLTTNARKSFSSSTPTASSTPLSAMATMQKEYNDKQKTSDKATKALVASKEDKIKSLPVKSTTNSQANEKLPSAQEKPLTSLASSLNTAAAEKIQIEDIESILSHLHGT